VQRYAQLNREIMAEEIMKGMKLKAQEARSSVHNYFDASEGMRILRKGAISARRGEQLVIPVNMRDGIILGTGKGNPEWNFSAPHGSGRKIRRDEVKER
ncbi:MAG: RtcB family protein, partial [Eisenbergiella massiliensis]